MVAAALLVGCGDTVDVEPAAAGNDPTCRRVLSGLPERLVDLDRRATGAVGAAAWGEPPVVLRCGVKPPVPTTDTCLSINDIDWVVVEDGGDGSGTFVTYGREPAVEVVIPPPSDSQLLATLTDAITSVPQTRRCL